MNEDLTRSQFLRKALGRVGLHLSRKIEEKLETIMPAGHRVPWSLERSAFLAVCEKCGACGEICPKGVIYYHSRDNRVFAGTPYLDFSGSYCDYCGECVKVCPSGALSFENGVKEIGKAKIAETSCVIKSEDCANRCMDLCPESAISINASGFPSVDPDRCTGCGRCIAACKGMAITIT